MGLSEQRQVNHFDQKMRPVVPSPYENQALWFIIMIRAQCNVSMLLSTECTQGRCDVDGRTDTHGQFQWYTTALSAQAKVLSPGMSVIATYL